MSKTVRLAPKRRIERITAVIDHSIPSSANDLDLHVAEDAKTLVRIKGHFNIVQGANDAAIASRAFSVYIGVNPQGTTIVTPALGQSLDNDTPDQELFRIYGSYISTTSVTGQEANLCYEFDSKAMRKLKAGDTIGLRSIGGANNILDIGGVVYMWFKE